MSHYIVCPRCGEDTLDVDTLRCDECGHSGKNLPNPSNCVEFVNEDGRRFAWSESNVCYEEVPEDGGSFTVLRKRLGEAENKVERMNTVLTIIREAGQNEDSTAQWMQMWAAWAQQPDRWPKPDVKPPSGT